MTNNLSTVFFTSWHQLRLKYRVPIYAAILLVTSFPGTAHLLWPERFGEPVISQIRLLFFITILLICIRLFLLGLALLTADRQLRRDELNFLRDTFRERFATFVDMMIRLFDVD